LDDQELSKYVLSSNRNRAPEHKELEKALAEWQLRYDRHLDLGLTTKELLVLKAKRVLGQAALFVTTVTAREKRPQGRSIMSICT
jgi:hypothetical protein